MPDPVGSGSCSVIQARDGFTIVEVSERELRVDHNGHRFRYIDIPRTIIEAAS